MKNNSKNEKLIYLCESRYKELNDYEKEHGVISYKTLLNYYNMPRILCNNIIDIDECLYDNIEVGNIYDEESGNYVDIYQYFITDLREWELEDIQKKYNNELIIAYSEKLENYILMVDHFGTSWNYVLTNIKYTTDWETYDKWEKELEEQENGNNEE